MTDTAAPHASIYLIDQARRLLATLPADSATWPRLRWVIVPRAFDAYRAALEAQGILNTAVEAPAPTLFGLPYDFGYPSDGKDLALVVSVDG